MRLVSSLHKLLENECRKQLLLHCSCSNRQAAQTSWCKMAPTWNIQYDQTSFCIIWNHVDQLVHPTAPLSGISAMTVNVSMSSQMSPSTAFVWELILLKTVVTCPKMKNCRIYPFLNPQPLFFNFWFCSVRKCWGQSALYCCLRRLHRGAPPPLAHTSVYNYPI